MSVRIKISQILRQFTEDHDTVEVNGSTVGECLDDMIRQFPEVEKWLFDRNGILLVLVLINGETTVRQREDLKRPVADGDELHLIRVVGGG